MQLKKISYKILSQYIIMFLAFIVSFPVPIYLSQTLPVKAEGGEIVRFHPYRQWTPEYSDADGWKDDPTIWRTIQFADINGDGMDDVCGRGNMAMLCSHSDGNNLGDFAVWSVSFTDLDGWHTHPSYWQTIRFPDVNGDGTADICGRGAEGLMCGLSDGSIFAEATNWHPGFGDAYNWQVDEAYWGTIRFPI